MLRVIIWLVYSSGVPVRGCSNGIGRVTQRSFSRIGCSSSPSWSSLARRCCPVTCVACLPSTRARRVSGRVTHAFAALANTVGTDGLLISRPYSVSTWNGLSDHIMSQ